MFKIKMQTIIRGNEIVEESQIETLERLREQYFKEYLNDIQIFKINLRQRTESYKNTIKQIDEDLEKLRKKENIKHKELQSINKKLWR
jgi:hypothetical protein